VPGTIAEWAKVRVGGVDQWLALWGRSRELPVLLFLHGGPGSAETPFLLRWHRDLGEHFLVVSWDQRGAGRTASATADQPASSWTVERFAEDVREVTQYLKARFGVRKIYLAGHSWGAALGLLTAARNPEDYAAYIGLSQPAGLGECALEAWRWASAEAARRGDRRALAELEAIGEPVDGRHRDGATGLERQLAVVARYGGGARHDGRVLPLAAALFGSPAYTFREKLGYLSVNRSTARLMYEEALRCGRLLEGVSELGVPLYLCHGRFDLQVPLAVTERLFERLRAPRKRLFVFERSAHGLIFEEPSLFHDILVDVVLRETGPGAAAGRAD
jgi:pimeloyl-ACP methyl ester carboxylesterase